MSWNDLWILLKKYRYVDSDCFNIRYIRLYTRQVLSTNSSPKLCIQSTLVNFPRNPSNSFKIYLICKIVSRDWIFHDFDTLTNIAENGCTRKNLIYGIVFVYFIFMETLSFSTYWFFYMCFAYKGHIWH